MHFLNKSLGSHIVQKGNVSDNDAKGNPLFPIQYEDGTALRFDNGRYIFQLFIRQNEDLSEELIVAVVKDKQSFYNPSDGFFYSFGTYDTSVLPTSFIQECVDLVKQAKHCFSGELLAVVCPEGVDELVEKYWRELKLGYSDSLEEPEETFGWEGADPSDFLEKEEVTFDNWETLIPKITLDNETYNVEVEKFVILGTDDEVDRYRLLDFQDVLGCEILLQSVVFDDDGEKYGFGDAYPGYNLIIHNAASDIDYPVGESCYYSDQLNPFLQKLAFLKESNISFKKLDVFLKEARSLDKLMVGLESLSSPAVSVAHENTSCHVQAAQEEGRLRGNDFSPLLRTAST